MKCKTLGLQHLTLRTGPDQVDDNEASINLQSLNVPACARTVSEVLFDRKD